MNEIIDIEAKVVPLEGTIANPFARSLATRHGRGPEQIFAPAVDAEMRGRRASGHVFKPDQIPEGAAGIPLETPPEVAVSKRAAKMTAEALTRLPVHCREQAGMCYIEVVFPMGAREFHGRTWFLALLSLKCKIDPAGRR